MSVYTKRNTCTGRHGYSTASEKFIISLTSRTRGVDEACECENVTSSTIYKDERQLCKYRSGHILAVLVQDWRCISRLLQSIWTQDESQ